VDFSAYDVFTNVEATPIQCIRHHSGGHCSFHSFLLLVAAIWEAPGAIGNFSTLILKFVNFCSIMYNVFFSSGRASSRKLLARLLAILWHPTCLHALLCPEETKIYELWNFTFSNRLVSHFSCRAVICLGNRMFCKHVWLGYVPKFPLACTSAYLYFWKLFSRLWWLQETDPDWLVLETLNVTSLAWTESAVELRGSAVNRYTCWHSVVICSLKSDVILLQDMLTGSQVTRLWNQFLKRVRMGLHWSNGFPYNVMERNWDIMYLHIYTYNGLNTQAWFLSFDRVNFCWILTGFQYTLACIFRHWINH